VGKTTTAKWTKMARERLEARQAAELAKKVKAEPLSEMEVAIERWRAEGPASFAVDVFAMDPVWDHSKASELQHAVVPWWWEASEKLVAKRKLSIRSGHGATKSAFLAITTLWFLACYHPAKIPCTAPTGHQLEDVLWPEISKWLRVMKEHTPALHDQYDWTKSALTLKGAPQEAFAVPRTARPENPEALQGFHSDNILFIVDEASGVHEAIFEVAQGALSTEGAFVILAANPTRTQGFFYDSFHRPGMRDRYAHVHVDCSDLKRAPLVSKSYVEDIAAKYGKDSNYYAVRVKGDFPTGDANTLISLALLEEAKVRKVAPTGAQVVWGLDVARFGDDRCALAKRSGNVQLEKVKTWEHKDTMQTAGMVYSAYMETKPELRPYRICVDVIGIGAGVADRLAELKLPVVMVHVAESPAVDPKKYKRLRDELWGLSSDWAKKRDCLLLDDEELIAELSSVTYKFDSDGRIIVESKDELKKRGLRSCDVADAWNLTFAVSSPIAGLNQQPLAPDVPMDTVD
jgi:phage terminase large subunit